jgi:hypothetical protein
LRVVTNAIDGKSIDIEDDRVVCLQCADLPKDSDDCVRIGIPKSKQIKVARWTVGIIHPGSHEHRALQDETLSIFA